MLVADSPSFVECWASRWLLSNQLHRTGLTFKRVCGNAGHLEIGKTLHLVWDCLL